MSKASKGNIREQLELKARDSPSAYGEVDSINRAIPFLKRMPHASKAFFIIYENLQFSLL